MKCHQYYVSNGPVAVFLQNFFTAQSMGMLLIICMLCSFACSATTAP